MTVPTDETEATDIGRLAQPYAPSWFDRFSGWVDKLPLPYWLFYPLISVLLIVLGLVATRIEGAGTIMDWDPISFVAMLQIAYMLVVVHYLDRYALRALDDFGPALALDDRHMPELRRLVSTLPSRRTFFTCVAFVMFGVALVVIPLATGQDFDSTLDVGITPFGFVVILVMLLLWLVNGLVVYHTVHQLNAVNYIYTNLTVVHPFHQRELYALSGLSARTGIAIVLVTPLWILFDPGYVSLSISIAFAIIGLVAFLSPLIGIHRILVREKDRLLDENGKQVEESISSLMSQLRNGDTEGLEQADQALSSLEKAREQIERISTWPWKTETPRQVIAAIFLPLLLWLIQYLLAQYLSS
jgi:hypothetical protein